MGRAVAEALTVFVVALAAAFLLGGAFVMLLGSDPSSAFFDENPRLVGVAMGIALVLWLAALVVGGIRNRARRVRRRFVTNLLSLVVAVLVNLIVDAVVAFATGGWGVFFLVFGIEAGLIVLASGLIALVLVHGLMFRGRAMPAAP